MKTQETQLLPEDTGSVVRFLNAFLDKSTRLVQHLDTQINMLIGISSAIFLFSATRALQQNQESLPFLILTFLASFSSFIALFAIHPPRFMRKRGQKESLLYNKNISSIASFKEYAEELQKLTTNKDAMIEQYSIEIYNLAKYYYRPKRRLFHASRNILIAGFIIFIILFIFKILT